MTELSHLNEDGEVRMVNVGDKQITHRTAAAEATVLMSPQTLRLVRDGGFRKGNVLEVARIAGIQAAKRTSSLIPLCHLLPLDGPEIEFTFPGDGQIVVRSTVSTSARTGVEMEALTAVSVCCLTIYDMCKSAEKGLQISSIRLLSKTGGRSGTWTADSPE